MKRTIPFAPQYTITKSGKVWKEREAVPAFTGNSAGLQQLVVRLGERRYFVWNLLSATWYGERMLLTRDGGLLNWDEDNVFMLTLKPESPWVKEPLSKIQLIWWHYQHERRPCVSMSDATGLRGYSVDEYRSLITGILISSVW